MPRLLCSLYISLYTVYRVKHTHAIAVSLKVWKNLWNEKKARIRSNGSRALRRKDLIHLSINECSRMLGKKIKHVLHDLQLGFGRFDFQHRKSGMVLPCKPVGRPERLIGFGVFLHAILNDMFVQHRTVFECLSRSGTIPCSSAHAFIPGK